MDFDRAFAELWMSEMKIPTDLDRPRRRRRTTLASALRQADRAGKPVASATITADNVTLTFGEPEATNNINEWDQVLRRGTH